MKSRSLFLFVFLFVSATMYSQDEPSKYEVVTSILRYDISAEDIDELKNFDWNFILESFSNNPPDKPVSVRFEYNQDGKLGDTHIDGFSFEVSGKSSEAQEIVDKSKSIIHEFISKN